MKPKPLNLEFESLYDFFPYKEVEKLMLKISKEGHSFPHYTTCKTCEADFEEVVRFTFKYVKQRIKSACEFYLKYKDDPELLWKEQLDNIEKLKAKRRLQQFLTNIREIPSPKGEVSCVHGWDMYDKCKLLKEYNKWLFKLAFRDVLKSKR